MQVFDYYDIKMLNYGNISVLKEVDRLVINPVERDNKLEFRTHKKSNTLFAISIRDIDKIELVRQIEGTFGDKEYFGLEITFNEKPLIGPQGQTHTILFYVNKYIESLQPLIQYLRDAEKDPIIQRKLKSDLNPTLCVECYKNEFVSILKSQKLCKDCFAKLYGKRVLYTPAEYHGGHKAYLAGGVFARFESGRMALTESHLIFLKDDVYDPLERIEIIIPLNSIVLESWTIQQETRRKEFSGGAVSYDNIGIGSLFMHDSGKSHRLVVPYIDENGIQQPVFGVSSFGGKAIRQLAAELYNRMVEVKRIHQQVDVANPNNTVIASQPSITANNSNETTESKEDVSKEKKDTFVKPRSAITIFSQPSIETPKYSIDEVTANKITTKETAQTAINENTYPKNDEFLNILKMRLVKGEISKEEYTELRKMIEES